jgi:ketosteroid isomerase-like protein
MSEEPKGFHDEVLQAAMSGDIERIASQFMDDAIVMPPNDTALYGKAEVRAWWEEYFRYFTIASSVETDRQITNAGDQMFDRRSVVVTIIPKERGARIRDEVRSLTVWNRQPGGGWKIFRQIWNSMKPVGSGTNRYMNRMLQKKPGQ